MIAAPVDGRHRGHWQVAHAEKPAVKCQHDLDVIVGGVAGARPEKFKIPASRERLARACDDGGPQLSMVRETGRVVRCGEEDVQDGGNVESHKAMGLTCFC